MCICTCRSTCASLALIALLASVYVLRWASAAFIPLLLGLMFSYAMSPAVNRLQHWRIPRALGAAVLLIAVLGSLGSMAYSLGDDAAALVESLPEAAQKLCASLRARHGPSEGTIEKVQKAAVQLEQAAEESGSPAPPVGKGVTRVQIERPHFDIKDHLWSSTLGLSGFIGQALLACFITCFLLASDDGMNPVAIFVGVLTMGWLWGIWGLLLGVPLLMAIEAVCERVDDLKSIGRIDRRLGASHRWSASHLAGTLSCQLHAPPP